MKSLSRLSANQARITYDAVVLILSAVAVNLLDRLLRGESQREVFFLIPLTLIACGAFGVYGKHKLAPGFTKAFVITLALLVAMYFAILSGQNIPLVLIWGLITWSPLVLPRLFVNVNRWQPLNRIEKRLNQTLKERGPILVVGGAGYIGTHLVEQLLKEGFRVRILDRLFYGLEPIRSFISNKNFELVEGDVTDIARLVTAMDGASAVVHLAGLVGDPACSIDARTTEHCNIIATRMVREVAQAFGIQRFVFASSCSVYGAKEEIAEEGSSLNPVSLYAKTKIASEEELLRYVRDDFFVTILRFATVFGHSLRPRFDLVGNLFTAQAWNGGEILVQGGDQWRPFIHVADIARAIVLVLKADPEVVQGQIFNVGDERLNITIQGLAEIVQKVVASERPVKLNINSGLTDPRNYRVSFEKIRRVLKFEAQHLFEGGIAEMLKHFKAGTYKDYKHSQYSNFEVTKEVVNQFHDPMQSSKLYAPIAHAG